MTPTPAEHARDARKALENGSPQEAIAHAVLAATGVLEAILGRMEAPAPLTVPGLPPGYELAARQSETGSRFWAYVLTAPDGTVTVSRYMWLRPQATVAPGVEAAQEHYASNANGGNHDDHPGKPASHHA